MKIKKYAAKLKAAVGLAILTSLGVSGVADAQLGVNRTGFEAVEDIQISNNGLIRVDLSGPGLDPAGCGRDVYVISQDQSSRNFWLAQLMTAKAAGQNVQIILNSTNCVNNGNNPQISVIVTE